MRTVLVVLALLFVPARALADEQRAWVREIKDAGDWKNYSKVVSSDELGKFIIDLKTNDIYFIDVNLFNIHADFVLGVLLKKAWTAENIREYNKNYERNKPKFILGYLTHHVKIDKWSFAFWEGDKIGADDVL
ncbi:MAG: pyruvate, phosphate dikinase, partial [Kofleriaceae bacterium]